MSNQESNLPRETFNHIEHVANELRRMLSRQKEMAPETVEYAQLMRNMEVLIGTSGMYEDIATVLDLADHGIRRIEIFPGGKAEDEPDEPDEPTADPAQLSPDEDEPPAGEKDAKAELEKTYEMADVRAALVAARRKGTNVTALLKEFGVDNFGAFPAGRYGELMEKLGAV